MPQLRSYTGFAATPSTGSAYNEGTQIGVQAYDAAQELQIKRAQLAQQAQQAAMEHSAKMEALQQEANIKSQELAVQKAYQTSLLGLKDRELQTDQAKLDFTASQAAQKFGAQESMRQEVEAAIAGGAKPGEAFASSAARYGTEAGLGGAELARAILGNGTGSGAAGLPPAQFEVVKDENGNPTGYRALQTGPNSRSMVAPQQEKMDSEQVQDATEGRKIVVNGRLLDNPVYLDVKDLQKQRDALQKRVDGPDWYEQRRAFEKSMDPDVELTPSQENRLTEYLNQRKVIEGLDAQITTLKSKMKPATLPPGMGNSGPAKAGRFQIIQAQ